MVDKFGDDYNFPGKGIGEGLGNLNEGISKFPELSASGFSLKIKKACKKIWGFLREDSWSSLLVTLILAIVVIIFIFFRGLSFLSGSSVYDDYGISIGDTTNWIFQNGFSKGDVIFVVGADVIEVGDVIIFEGGGTYPLIHRVVGVGDAYATKGDNYVTNSKQLSSEKYIDEDLIIGKALFKVPRVSWIRPVRS